MSLPTNDVKKVTEQLLNLNLKTAGDSLTTTSRRAQTAGAAAGATAAAGTTAIPMPAAGTGAAVLAAPKPILYNAEKAKKPKRPVILSESTNNKEVQKEEKVNKDKADTLYNLIRKHPDFDFYADIDKNIADLQKVINNPSSFDTATRFRQLLKTENNRRAAVKESIQKQCYYIVNVGGPTCITMSKKNKKFIDLVSKINNQLPANFWKTANNVKYKAS